MEYEIETLEFTPDPNKKYILVMRNFKQPASLDHMVKALQGVFPDKSPILLLNDEQNLEVYEVGENSTIKFNPPITPHIVAFLKEVFINDIVNETS